jgi:hypothetical protein
MLGFDRYGFHTKRAGTNYAELVLLHLVGFVGHVVYCGVPGRGTSTHYFSGVWGWCRFHKKRIGTHYAKVVVLYPVGSMGHVVHSGGSGA